MNLQQWLKLDRNAAIAIVIIAFVLAAGASYWLSQTNIQNAKELLTEDATVTRIAGRDLNVCIVSTNNGLKFVYNCPYNVGDRIHIEYHPTWDKAILKEKR